MESAKIITYVFVFSSFRAKFILFGFGFSGLGGSCGNLLRIAHCVLGCIASGREKNNHRKTGGRRHGQSHIADSPVRGRDDPPGVLAAPAAINFLTISSHFTNHKGRIESGSECPPRPQ